MLLFGQCEEKRRQTHHAYFVVNNSVQTYTSFDLFTKSQVMVKNQSMYLLDISRF
jgi:hypothetical protein